jgi:hypothetical protein
MATKRTGRKAGRPKKPLPVIPEPKQPVGRPETLDLRLVAFSKVTKMRTTRGNRTLGDNTAAQWLTALRKAGKDGLLCGAVAGDVTGSPKDFISDCPDGFIPVVPMQLNRDSPITIEQIAGSAKAMQKKAAEVFRTGDDATLRWFVEMAAVFGLVLAAGNRPDRGLWTRSARTLGGSRRHGHLPWRAANRQHDRPYLGQDISTIGFGCPGNTISNIISY